MVHIFGFAFVGLLLAPAFFLAYVQIARLEQSLGILMPLVISAGIGGLFGGMAGFFTPALKARRPRAFRGILWAVAGLLGFVVIVAFTI